MSSCRWLPGFGLSLLGKAGTPHIGCVCAFLAIANSEDASLPKLRRYVSEQENVRIAIAEDVVQLSKTKDIHRCQKNSNILMAILGRLLLQEFIFPAKGLLLWFKLCACLSPHPNLVGKHHYIWGGGLAIPRKVFEEANLIHCIDSRRTFHYQ